MKEVKKREWVGKSIELIRGRVLSLCFFSSNHTIKDRLFFVTSEQLFLNKEGNNEVFVHFNNLEVLSYTPFYKDFGPLSLGCVSFFCNMLDFVLGKNESGKRVVLVSGHDRYNRMNNVTLVGIYLVLSCGVSVDDVLLLFRDIYPPLIGYRDASYGASKFELFFCDIVGGVYEGSVCQGWFDYKFFRLDEYFYYDHPRHGDLNWVVPNRLLAFATPEDTSPSDHGGVKGKTNRHPPYFYVNLFRHWGVEAVFRFNRQTYNPEPFTGAGLKFFDLYYEDGSVPSSYILSKVFQCFENSKGAIAFHCKSGLGRTGTAIAAILIKYYSFTAKKAIAWIRVCRPGSVLGVQQEYLVKKEKEFSKMGETFKKRRGKKELIMENIDFRDSLRKRKRKEKFDKFNYSLDQILNSKVKQF